MKKIDLSKYNLRSDLIIEDESILHTEKVLDGLTITNTKASGNYITISFDDISDYVESNRVGKKLELVIKEMLSKNNIKENDACLIIGLGNRMSTPDSLGVKVLDNVIVTSHIAKLGKLDENMRIVSKIIPGVMGDTGIETVRIIKSLIKEIKPDFVIAIDALAARSIDRLNKTIQVTDTGIHPGSGVGNNRVEISIKTIGIPVIAIGVPTVTLSSTIVYDTIDYLYRHISYIKDNSDINKLTYMKSNYKNKLKEKNLTNIEKENLLGLFGGLSMESQYELINEVLSKINLNLIVTPTEIDFLIDKLSNMIANSINNALHRQIMHL